MERRFINMASYTVALTSTGQMTLPKALRVFLGVDGAKRVRLEETKDGVKIKRKMNQEELFAFFDSHIDEKTRKIIEEDRKKGITTVRQIREEIAKSPEEKKRLEEEYGLHPSPRYA